jgi:hypothetical protein
MLLVAAAHAASASRYRAAQGVKHFSAAQAPVWHLLVAAAAILLVGLLLVG